MFVSSSLETFQSGEDTSLSFLRNLSSVGLGIICLVSLIVSFLDEINGCLWKISETWVVRFKAASRPILLTL